MGVIVLDDNGDGQLKGIIEICKSSSCSSGAKLRGAHYAAGRMLAVKIAEREKIKHGVAVVIMMRAGLPFGLGIADKMEECRLSVDVFFNDDTDRLEPDNYEKIIFVDAVVRTGKAISLLADSVAGEWSDKIVFATNVLDHTGASGFVDRTLYAVRVSGNSYKGTSLKTIEGGKGPDTGDRLFFSDFYRQ